MEETVRAFNYVIENGMALYWGTSEWSADEIAEAIGIAKDLRMIAPIVEQPFCMFFSRSSSCFLPTIPQDVCETDRIPI